MLSIVIPAFNEEQALPDTIARIRRAFPLDLADGVVVEAIVLSDGSEDATFDIATGCIEGNLRGRVVEFSSNVGSHAAIRCGMELATGDAIAVISGDGQDPPELLPDMFGRLGSTADVVWGRRANRGGDSWFSRSLATIYYRLFRLITRLDYPDSGLDFLVMNRRVRDAIGAFPERNLPLFLTVFNLGFFQTYVDYERLERSGGKSGWTTRKKVRIAVDMVISVSAAPLRLLSIIGAGVGLLGLAFATVTLLRAIAGQTPDSGWASLMIAISTMGGLILVGLSILGEYVWRVLDEVRNRPLYIISRDTGPM